MKIGSQVFVSADIPLDRNKRGTVISRHAVPLDYRGVPKVLGHYKRMGPCDMAIRTDAGEILVYPRDYYRPVSTNE